MSQKVGLVGNPRYLKKRTDYLFCGKIALNKKSMMFEKKLEYRYRDVLFPEKIDQKDTFIIYLGISCYKYDRNDLEIFFILLLIR